MKFSEFSKAFIAKSYSQKLKGFLKLKISWLTGSQSNSDSNPTVLLVLYTKNSSKQMEISKQQIFSNPLRQSSQLSGKPLSQRCKRRKLGLPHIKKK